MSAKKPPRNGKPGLTLSEPGSKVEFLRPSKDLKRALTKVYNHFQKLEDATENATARHDFVFHMTDWLNDLESLSALYQAPTKFDKDQVDDIIFGFLLHAVPHLRAARRLLIPDMTDPFAPDQQTDEMKGKIE